MTRYMTGGTRRRGEASDLPVLVHCRTVAGGPRLFEDPFLLAPILTHKILTGAKNLLGTN